MSNELDKHISERLHRYESAVDAEVIWDAVKPPRRRRPWFLLLLIFGGISLAGGLWWMLTQYHGASSDAESVEQINQKPTLKEGGTINQAILADQAAQEQQSTSKNSNTEKNSLIPANDKHLGEGERANYHAKHDEKQTGKALEQQETTTFPSLQKTDIPKDDEYKKGEQHIDEFHREDVINNTLPTQQKEGNIALLLPNETIKKEEKAPLSSTIRLLSPINQPLPTLLDFLPSHTPKRNDTISYEKEMISLSSKRSPWSIQTDLAYLWINRELSGADSINHWVNQRLATESVLEALNIDFSINYAFHNNWQLRLALGYTQINTSFTYENTTTKVDSIEGLQMLIFNLDNTVDSIYGPIGRHETAQRQLEIYNSFRQIELPILINYESRWGSLSLIAEAGARIRLHRNWEGQLAGLNGEIASLEDQAWYRNGLGVSLQAGLQLGYTLSDQLQVRLGGTIRYSPTNFSKEEVNFEERYQLRGLQLGLSYQLQ